MTAAMLATGGVYGAACTSRETTDEIDPRVADVVFEGEATDDALLSLIDAAPVTDAARGPHITSPPPNTVTTRAEVLTFTWEPGGSSARLPSPSRAGALALLPAGDPPPARWLVDLLGPERAASAAAAKMSGPGYFLDFSTAQAPHLLRVFTTSTSYTPDEAAWKTLGSAGMWTKLTILSAEFQDDKIVEGTGPFAGDPVEFCIEAE